MYIYIYTFVHYRINANSNYKRGKEQIRKKWQDLQAAAKKKDQQRKKEIQMTGGGSSPKDLTQTEQKVSYFAFQRYICM